TSLEALIAELPTSVSSSEIRLHCKEEDKGRVIKAARDFFGSRRDVEVISVDGVRAHTPLGWGLLRASNTQSLISMRFESSTTEGLKEIQSEFSEVLSPFFEKAELEKHFKN
ncbi:phosphomannomutase, partial [bacterium]|nr:phosphomannomutase [bacterium]